MLIEVDQRQCNRMCYIRGKICTRCLLVFTKRKRLPLMGGYRRQIRKGKAVCSNLSPDVASVNNVVLALAEPLSEYLHTILIIGLMTTTDSDERSWKASIPNSTSRYCLVTGRVKLVASSPNRSVLFWASHSILQQVSGQPVPSSSVYI